MTQYREQIDEAPAFWRLLEVGALLYVGFRRRNGASDYSDAKLVFWG